MSIQPVVQMIFRRCSSEFEPFHHKIVATSIRLGLAAQDLLHLRVVATWFIKMRLKKCTLIPTDYSPTIARIFLSLKAKLIAVIRYH